MPGNGIYTRLGSKRHPGKMMETEKLATGQELGQHTTHGRSPVPAEAPSKPITVTVEEPRSQSVRPGADVTFICTAKSKVGKAGSGHRGDSIFWGLGAPPLTPSPSPCPPAVSGLHPGVDPPAQWETARPSHGFQWHPDHSQRPAK